jgi:hypothetical protein
MVVEKKRESNCKREISLVQPGSQIVPPSPQKATVSLAIL